MKKETLLAVSLVSVVAAGMLAGCGGSSSSNPASATIAGKVADGYLEKATVFLDKNENYRLDPGEPSFVTAADGSYTLTVDPADVGRYPVVALAIAGVTIDRDTDQPVAHSYLLSLPKDSVTGTVNANFISPLSSQIREMMETGSYATMQEAMDALRVNLGLPAGTNMMGDYLAGSGIQPMHEAAQSMAGLMGGQAFQLYSSGGNSNNIDVNRYRGMMGTIFSNLSSLRGNQYSPSMMTEFAGSMTNQLGTIPVGAPFLNMSSFFGGGMNGGGMNGGGMNGGNMGGSIGGGMGGGMMGN